MLVGLHFIGNLLLSQPVLPDGEGRKRTLKHHCGIWIWAKLHNLRCVCFSFPKIFLWFSCWWKFVGGAHKALLNSAKLHLCFSSSLDFLFPTNVKAKKEHLHAFVCSCFHRFFCVGFVLCTHANAHTVNRRRPYTCLEWNRWRLFRPIVVKVTFRFTACSFSVMWYRKPLHSPQLQARLFFW